MIFIFLKEIFLTFVLTIFFYVAYNVYNRHLLFALLIHHIYLFSNRLNSSMDLRVKTVCDDKTVSQVVLSNLVTQDWFASQLEQTTKDVCLSTEKFEFKDEYLLIKSDFFESKGLSTLLGRIF